MRYKVTIKGISPLIQHCGRSGLDTRSPEALEKAQITKKKGSNRTEKDDARLRELETLISFWLDDEGLPTIPPHALRATIENAARKLKQGAQVREGLVVEFTEKFEWDRKLGEKTEDLARSESIQFEVPVVIQRSRLLKTRAKFDEWSATFLIDTDPELVDQDQLERWLFIAGRRIGLGDWRPQKSGLYGRFEVEKIEEVDD